MTSPITRAQLLDRSVRTGAALVVGGVTLSRFVETASGDPLPPLDLAYARLLVAVELLSADFYSEAVAAANTGAVVRRYLERALLNEQEHYASVAEIVSGAGATVAVAGDFTFSYPRGTFRSKSSIVRFAVQLEELSLGAYLGAIGGIQTLSFEQGLAQIAACEAQHLSYFSVTSGARAFNLSFPPALPINQASNLLDEYTA